MALHKAGLLHGLTPILMVGCAEPSAPLFSSAHFEYYAEPGDVGCSTVLETLEEHLEVVTEQFSLSPPKQRIVYEKFPTPEALRQARACPEIGAACAGISALASTRAFDRHELTHVYFATLGRPPVIFREGIAEALGCDALPLEGPSLGLVEALQRPSHDLEMRTAAARFTGYIVHGYGPERYAELYARLPEHASAAEIELYFQSIYGVPLVSEWDSAQAAGLETPEVACIRVWECGRKPLEFGELEAIDTECDASDEFRTVRPEPGEGLSYVAVPGEATRLASCDPTRPTPFQGKARPPALDRGAHVFTAEVSAYFIATNASGPGVLVDQLELSTIDCGAAPAPALFHYEYGLTVHATRSGTLLFRFPGLWPVAGVLVESSPGTRARTCASCEGTTPASCVTIDSDQDNSGLPPGGDDTAIYAIDFVQPAVGSAWFRVVAPP